MLDNLKIRLGIPIENFSVDALLELKIQDAKNLFMNYCNRSDIPETAMPLIEQLAVSLYEDRRGVVSEKMGDTSYTYADSTLSGELTRQLNRYRKVRVL
ncbi:MAG: phage head-tail connector protein [Bacillales bacterium]|nr:phage head-tail connector protein [Bacillales bacterium]